MPADPQYVRDAFSAIAPRYVCVNHVLSLGIDVIWRRRVAKIVADAKPSSILDVATGSGDLAAELTKRCPGAHIIGSDFCEPMLNHARRRGLANLIVADGMNLPFPERTFDALTVAFGLRNMPSFQGALLEFARVLKPGGLLAVLDFSLPRFAPIRWPYRLYLEKVMPCIGGLITGQPGPYHYLARSIGEFPSGEAMLKLVRETGFGNERWQPLSFGVASIYLGTRS